MLQSILELKTLKYLVMLFVPLCGMLSCFDAIMKKKEKEIQAVCSLIKRSKHMQLRLSIFVKYLS